MTVLKHVTGLFAIFLITVLPLRVKAVDVCEDSRDRMEAYVSAFVDEVENSKEISEKSIGNLALLMSYEPDLCEFRVTVGIKYLVPDGGSYFVNMEHEQVIEHLDREGALALSEGDTVRVRVSVVSPSVFSRIAGMSYNRKGEAAERVSMGRRIGR